MSSIISSGIGLLGSYPYYKLAALFFSVMLFRHLKKGGDANPNGLPLPPGPKGYPLIGNLFDMPVHKPWIVYDEWSKTYGKTFIIHGLSLHNNLNLDIFRWYHIPQCSWPKLCNFKFFASRHRPVREKVFKLLGQKADDYVDWTVCIITFLSLQITCQICRSIQNGSSYKHGFDAIRPVVAFAQEIISWIFPPERGE